MGKTCLLLIPIVIFLSIGIFIFIASKFHVTSPTSLKKKPPSDQLAPDFRGFESLVEAENMKDYVFYDDFMQISLGPIPPAFELDKICQNGIPTEDMIPQEFLLKMLQDVRDNLNHEVQLAISSFHQYYKVPLIHCLKDEDTNWSKIFLEIPLLKRNVQLQVFKVKYLPFNDDEGGRCEFQMDLKTLVIFDPISEQVRLFRDSPSEQCMFHKLCKISESTEASENVNGCIVQVIQELFPTSQLHRGFLSLSHHLFSS